jgi:hypothetical protein
MCRGQPAQRRQGLLGAPSSPSRSGRTTNVCPGSQRSGGWCAGRSGAGPNPFPALAPGRPAGNRRKAGATGVERLRTERFEMARLPRGPAGTTVSPLHENTDRTRSPRRTWRIDARTATDEPDTLNSSGPSDVNAALAPKTDARARTHARSAPVGAATKIPIEPEARRKPGETTPAPSMNEPRPWQTGAMPGVAPRGGGRAWSRTP